MFVTALLVMVLQIVFAHKVFIKPLSMPKDLTFFYAVILASYAVFPIVLSIIFSFILDRIKWLDKKSFILCFLIVSYFYFVVGGIEFFHVGDWWRYFSSTILAYFWYILYPFVFIGYPFVYILGWENSWFPFLVIFATIGVISFSFVFAFIYSWFSYLAKKGKTWKLPRRIFVGLFLLLLVIALVDAAIHAYIHLAAK